MRVVMTEMNLQAAAQAELLRASREKTSHPMLLLTNVGGAGTSRAPDYNCMARQGIDTVLELEFLGTGLKGFRSGKDEPLAAFIAIRVRLVRVQGGALLYAHTFVTEGGNRTFLDWASDNARALRAEFTRLAPRQADAVIEELFLAYDPRQHSKTVE